MRRMNKFIIISLFYYLLNGMFMFISLNLSRDENIKGKLKMESAFVTNLTYSINIYQIRMKREMN